VPWSISWIAETLATWISKPDSVAKVESLDYKSPPDELGERKEHRPGMEVALVGDSGSPGLS
jgi:hypothetical protein